MLYLTIIPLGLLFVPWLLARYVFATIHTRGLAYRTHAGYLWLAAALSVASQVVPNIPVSPQTDTFSMHLTGGAMAAALFAYVVAVYKVRFTRLWQPWVALYFFVSGLGVLNELMELFLDQTRLMPMVSGDEWWDLVANTMGAALAYAFIVLLRREN